MNSEKLESLSLEALCALAEKMGLDLPAGLDRPFVVEEILDALVEDSEDRRSAGDEAVHVDEKKYSGSELDGLDAPKDDVPGLESRYNETTIRALVRDPSWAFAYWDVSDSERAALAGEESAAPLFLRVVDLSSGCEDAACEHFDIPVSADDQQWYINLPHGGMRFRIDLCTRKAGNHSARARTLARSNILSSPRQELHPGPGGIDQSSARLLNLSGISDLRIQTIEPDNPLRITSPGVELQPGDGD
ncbi:MAG TPA: DUF4912 domain-containing protein [Rectinemataceae bacterium]|nr:DUF4912 domain-containing protein [Rectinemataceae bacterium]